MFSLLLLFYHYCSLFFICFSYFIIKLFSCLNLFLKMSFQPFYLTDCQLIVSEIWRAETMLRFPLKGSFKNLGIFKIFRTIEIVNTNDLLKSTFSICQFEVSFVKKRVHHFLMPMVFKPPWVSIIEPSSE